MSYCEIRNSCMICHEPIMDFEDHCVLPGYEEVHYECAINLTQPELLELFGVSPMKAKPEERQVI